MKFYCILLIIYLPNFCFGQLVFSFKNLTTKHGLPSNTCYYITQDHKNNIWIATNKGIAKFNGVELKIWNHKNGLPDEDIIYLKEDSKKRMWASTSGGRLFYIHNDNVYDYRVNKQLAPLKLASWITTSMEDKEGNIWFSSFLKETIKIDTDNQATFYFYPHSSNNIPDLPYGRLISDFSNDEDGNPEIFFSSYGQIRFKDLKKPINTHFKGWFYKSDWVCKSNDSTIYFSNKNIIYVIKNNRIYDSLDFRKKLKKITKIDKLGPFGFYVSDGKTIYSFKEGGKKSWKVSKIISEEGVDKVFLDKENNLWINSIHKGVYILYDTLVKTLISPAIKNSRITAVMSTQNEIIAGSDYGKFFIIDNNSVVTEKELSEGTKEGRGRINSIIKIDSNNILISQEKNLYLKHNNEIKLLPFGSKNISIVGNKLGISFSNNFYLIPIKEIINLSYNFNLTKYSVLPGTRTNGSIGDSGKFLYIATSEGLLFIDKLKNTTYNFFKEKGLNFPVKNIELMNNDIILAGVDGIGLFLIHKERIIEKYPFSLPFNLTINRIRKIKNLVFICSSNGLLIYIWSRNSLKFLRQLDNRDGLNSNNINDIAETNKNYVLASDSSLNFVDKKYISFNHLKTPNPSLFKIQINNKIINPTNIIERPKGSKTTLVILPNTFKWIGNHFCRYRPEFSNNWTYCSGNHLEVNPFEGYQTKILVEQKTVFGSWQRIGHNIFVKNEYSWLEKLYFDQKNRLLFFSFIALVIILVTISIYGFYLLSKDLQEKALLLVRAEIKPHMLINAISSLQYQYSQGNYEEGNTHIQNYKKFLGEFMKSSDRDFIQLDQELVTLRNYLNYESKKDNKNISYSINIENIMSYDRASIPSMIIQPLVENCIKHAFPENIKRREIKIVIVAQRTERIPNKFGSTQIESLQIIISDNGRGFEADRFGTGLGSKSILQKISLLNSKYNIKIDFSFDSIPMEKSFKGSGSKFRIFIPYRPFETPLDQEEDLEKM